MTEAVIPQSYATGEGFATNEGWKGKGGGRRERERERVKGRIKAR